MGVEGRHRKGNFQNKMEKNRDNKEKVCYKNVSSASRKKLGSGKRITSS